jgi:hypothetical protein
MPILEEALDRLNILPKQKSSSRANLDGMFRLVTKSPIAALRSSSKLSLTSSQLKFFRTRRPCSERFRDKSFDGIKDIFIDATERPVNRPHKQKSQRKHDSAKQKDKK